MNHNPVRDRFAPSPTGFLHIGGVRTALFNYLLAKQSAEGKFILRLEDTDRERFLPESIAQIVGGLDWLGLKADEGFWINQGKPQGTEYIQSERLKTGLYQAVADSLMKQKLAYHSQISLEAYAQLKTADRSKPFVYKRTMEIGDPGHLDGPIRLDTAAIKTQLNLTEISWHDEVRGDFTNELDLMEDFILIKSDGFPTYNFANVIDDHDMHISHVIRGDEFIASTAKHALLYQILGWEAPKFVHLPVINGTDGKKLSKRSGDINVLDYQAKGYLPEALLNFLVLLGWNAGAGERQEIFSLGELIKRFSLEHVQKSPAVFDAARLDWMNGQHIRALKPDELLDRIVKFLDGSALAKMINKDPVYSLAAVQLIHDRIKRLDETEELMDFFYTDPQKLSFGKIPPAEVKKYLEATIAALTEHPEAFDDFGADLEKLMRETVLASTGGDKPGPLFMTIRIAITGKTATPGLFETMVALGPETVVRRLEAAFKGL